MRLTIHWSSITVLVGCILLAGCATPRSPAVTVQPVACAIHYRDLTQHWVAAEYRCAQAGHPLPLPRIRTLADRQADTQGPIVGAQHEVR